MKLKLSASFAVLAFSLSLYATVESANSATLFADGTSRGPSVGTVTPIAPLVPAPDGGRLCGCPVAILSPTQIDFTRVLSSQQTSSGPSVGAITPISVPPVLSSQQTSSGSVAAVVMSQNSMGLLTITPVATGTTFSNTTIPAPKQSGALTSANLF